MKIKYVSDGISANTKEYVVGFYATGIEVCWNKEVLSPNPTKILEINRWIDGNEYFSIYCSTTTSTGNGRGGTKLRHNQNRSFSLPIEYLSLFDGMDGVEIWVNKIKR